MTKFPYSLEKKISKLGLYDKQIEAEFILNYVSKEGEIWDLIPKHLRERFDKEGRLITTMRNCFVCGKESKIFHRRADERYLEERLRGISCPSCRVGGFYYV